MRPSTYRPPQSGPACEARSGPLRERRFPMTSFSPREIVSELDRFIVGQHDAKRAVAIALRNRWRRQQLAPELREEVLPKNILMIGPTGCGKTEIARRLARLAQAPFRQGRGDQVHRGRLCRPRCRADRARPRRDRDRHDPRAAAQRGRAQGRSSPPRSACSMRWSAPSASADTRQKFRKMLREGALDDREIEIAVQESAAANLPTFEIPGMPGAQMGMLNLGDIFGKAFGTRSKPKKMTVADSHRVLIAEESDKLLDQEMVVREAIDRGRAERHRLYRRDRQDLRPQRARRRRRGRCQPRRGAARPVAADRGHDGRDQARRGQDRPHPVHRLGRVPPGETLRPAARIAGPAADPGRIEGARPRRSPPHPDRAGSEPDQAIQGVARDRGGRPRFRRGAIDEIALLAEQINATVENIGARRLHTILERLLEEISFTASDQPEGTQVRDRPRLCPRPGRRARRKTPICRNSFCRDCQTRR